VLALSIVYTVHIFTDFIERERRRLNKANTNAVIARLSFENNVRKNYLFLFLLTTTIIKWKT
jgi:hypothetical protein